MAQSGRGTTITTDEADLGWRVDIVGGLPIRNRSLGCYSEVNLQEKQVQGRRKMQRAELKEHGKRSVALKAAPYLLGVLDYRGCALKPRPQSPGPRA